MIARGYDSHALARIDGEMVFQSRSILWSRGRLDRFDIFDRFRAKAYVFEAQGAVSFKMAGWGRSRSKSDLGDLMVHSSAKWAQK